MPFRRFVEMLVHACDAASACGTDPAVAVLAAPLLSLVEASATVSDSVSTAASGIALGTTFGTSGITSGAGFACCDSPRLSGAALALLAASNAPATWAASGGWPAWSDLPSATGCDAAGACLLVDEHMAGEAIVLPKHLELLGAADDSDLHGGLCIGIMAWHSSCMAPSQLTRVSGLQ